MRRIFVFLLAICLLLPMGVRAGAVELETAGKSAVLMDAATGTVLYEKNAHEPLAPASVTKVMTMLLIMEAIDSGKIGWNDTVTASETAAAKGGSQVYLKAGETMSVSDMVKSIAVSSANDCACAMAEHLAGSEGAFVAQMNKRAQELGMEHTHFVNCTGLDDEPEAAQHLTCAYDIALMSRQLLTFHPDIKKFTTIWMDTVRDGSFGLANTNKLVRFYSGATGLKTGFTAKAGYCLSASALRDGMELIELENGGIFKSIHGDLYVDSIWYSLYGSKGNMESARESAQNGAFDRIYIHADEYSGGYDTTKKDTYLPTREQDEQAKSFGHGTSDFYTMYNFVRKIQGDPDADIIDVYEALDMFLPGLFA